MPERVIEARAPSGIEACRTCADVLPTTAERIKGALISPTAAVSLRGKYWTNGQTVKVSFEDRLPVDGERLQQRVRPHVEVVFGHVNLSLLWVPAGEGDVRISFTRGGSWSYLGTDARLIPKDRHTLQLGWLEASSDEAEVRRVVRHEILHALAIGHEQAHPDANIPWDRPKVYEHYRRTQGWSQAEVDAQVLQRYDRGQTQYTEYDPTSIMQYPVPNELTVGDFEIPWNSDLSSLDVRHLKEIYPKPTDEVCERLTERDGVLTDRINRLRRIRYRVRKNIKRRNC